MSPNSSCLSWAFSCFQMFTSVRVVRLSNVNLTNQGLNKIFTDLCENLLKVRKNKDPQVVSIMFLYSSIFCQVLVFMFAAEFLLQATIDDPLLSLSSQLHRGSPRRRAHPGENRPSFTNEMNPGWNANLSPFGYFFLSPRWQLLQWPWRLTKTRPTRSHQTSPSPKVCVLVCGSVLFPHTAQYPLKPLKWVFLGGTSAIVKVL